MRKEKGLILIFLVIILTAYVIMGASSNSEFLMQLSSLKPGLVLKKRWMGLVPAFPWGVWLEYESMSYLVIQPVNLLNHVMINTKEKALEYARFFSSIDTYDLFDLDGMVEVLPRRGKEEHELEINELAEKTFNRYFHLASVEELPMYKPRPAEKDEGCCRGQSYYVKRIMLFPDSSIHDIVEHICDDGYYHIVSDKSLMKVEDAWYLGLDYCLNRKK